MKPEKPQQKGKSEPERLEGGRRHNVYIDDTTWAIALQLGNGNASERIRIALQGRQDKPVAQSTQSKGEKAEKRRWSGRLSDKPAPTKTDATVEQLGGQTISKKGYAALVKKANQWRELHGYVGKGGVVSPGRRLPLDGRATYGSRTDGNPGWWRSMRMVARGSPLVAIRRTVRDVGSLCRYSRHDQ